MLWMARQNGLPKMRLPIYLFRLMLVNLRKRYIILLLNGQIFQLIFLTFEMHEKNTLTFVTHKWMHSIAVEEYMAILFHPCSSVLFRGTRRAFPALSSHPVGRNFHNEVPRNWLQSTKLFHFRQQTVLRKPFSCQQVSAAGNTAHNIFRINQYRPQSDVWSKLSLHKWTRNTQLWLHW